MNNNGNQNENIIRYCAQRHHPRRQQRAYRVTIATPYGRTGVLYLRPAICRIYASPVPPFLAGNEHRQLAALHDIAGSRA